jgi:hypothetical protein
MMTPLTSKFVLSFFPPNVLSAFETLFLFDSLSLLSYYSVRLAVGNGLRPDIWKQFQDRFKISTIGEFYGSTEGNATLMNSQNKVGSVGFVSPLIQKVVPLSLVKFDIENEVPIRNKAGFCIPCATGEIGELLGLIENSDPLRQFAGYTDKGATEKKVKQGPFFLFSFFRFSLLIPLFLLDSSGCVCEGRLLFSNR